LFASGTELAAVHVIGLMAGMAVIRQAHGIVRAFRMARVTSEAFVAAVQSEIGPFVVVKGPQPPTIGVVALLAMYPQGSVVAVVVLVAAPTGLCRALIRRCDMALFTGCCRVQADEGEVRQVVVEQHAVPPATLVVAGSAPLTQLAGVSVVGAVAAMTVAPQAIVPEITSMASGTRDAFVPAL
jgi:hypothetical protein